MTVNFRASEINRSACKLGCTPIITNDNDNIRDVYCKIRNVCFIHSICAHVHFVATFSALVRDGVTNCCFWETTTLTRFQYRQRLR